MQFEPADQQAGKSGTRAPAEIAFPEFAIKIKAEKKNR
jgi:hypothetical protein